MFKPELLSPGGNAEKICVTLSLMAQMLFMRASRVTSLRVRNNEFNHENLQLGINEAHALGKKVLCRGQHCTAQRQAEKPLSVT